MPTINVNMRVADLGILTGTVRVTTHGVSQIRLQDAFGITIPDFVWKSNGGQRLRDLAELVRSALPARTKN